MHVCLLTLHDTRASCLLLPAFACPDTSGGAGTLAGVVPQQPFLFEGSVRHNLDPLGRCGAAELAGVLRQVALWRPLVTLAEAVPHAAAGGSGAALGQQQQQQREGEEEAAVRERVLSLPLAEGGAALSQGQQQLLALARVLLQRPRLVVLDEATSSVDPATAALMHEVGWCGWVGGWVGVVRRKGLYGAALGGWRCICCLQHLPALCSSSFSRVCLPAGGAAGAGRQHCPRGGAPAEHAAELQPW